MLKLPSFNLDSQKKFTPEELQGFKDTADVDEAKKRARQTLTDYQNAIAQAQSIFSQSAQMQTPERQQVGRKEGLLLTLGDALRNVVSTAPRKYRQPQTPGIQVSQGLKDQEYARQLQDAQIGYQNQQNQILAGQRAAEVGLRKFELGYENAKGEVAAETDEARFNRTQGLNEAQFRFSIDSWRSDAAYRDKVFDQNKKEFEDNLAWDKEKFNTTEWDFAQKDFEKMVDSGMNVETARKRAFGKYILQDKQIDKLDVDLQTAQKLFNEVLPEQIKDQLAEYVFNKKMRPIQLRNAANQGGRPQSPLDPFTSEISRIGKLIETAQFNKAEAEASPVGVNSQRGDPAAFDRLINYYRGQQAQLARDANFKTDPSGKTVVIDPEMFGFQDPKTAFTRFLQSGGR